MPSVYVTGEQIFYTRHARDVVDETHAPTLLLVHGAGGTHLHWPPRLRRLPAVVVYALDLPGHGRSQGHGLSSVAAYEETVTTLMGELGLTSVILAGHSMGAAIALQCALSQPAGLAGLCLLGAGARYAVAPAILDRLLNDFDVTTELIADSVYSAGVDRQQRFTFLSRLCDVPPKVLYGDFVACNEFDVRVRLGEIDVPSLVICGAGDRMTPPKYSEYLVERLACADLQMVDCAGHMVMLEQPDAVTHSVAQFISGLH